MHIDAYLVLGSAAVGLLVGLTGMGGGALMTPMLVLLFGIAPSTAISSDLLAALFMRPFGAVVHWRRGSINGDLVKWLSVGSVPGALFGTYAMHLTGRSAIGEHRLEIVLGLALIVGATTMLVRTLVAPGSATSRVVSVRPLATCVTGAVGGFMVGLTSVGAGSLMLVLLVVLYPTMENGLLVGTDLAQSIPLTLSATVGALLFGNVDAALSASIILGSVPAVVVGSLLSSRSKGPVLRRLITGVVLLSGLKYVGVPATELVIIALALAVLFGSLAWRARRDVHASTRLIAESVQNIVTLLPTRLDRDL